MKKLTTLLLLLTLFCSKTYTQANKPVEFPWNFYAFNKIGETFKLFPGHSVDIEIMLKDSSGLPVYTETHSGVLDNNSFLSVIIGNGQNANPPILTTGLLTSYSTLCWKVTIHTIAGPQTIMGEELATSVPKAILAEQSANSNELGGNKFEPQPNTFEQVFNPDANMEDYNMVLLKSGQVPTQNTINLFPFKEYVNWGKSNASVTGEEVNVGRIGRRNLLGYKEDCFYSFGPEIAPVTDSYYEACVPFLKFVNHLLKLKIDDKPIPDGPPRLGNQNTAVLYTINKAAGLTAGIISSAGTWGILTNGNNGLVGSSTGGGNGAGIWGSVSQAPTTGGFKYAVFGQYGNFADSWAGAFSGPGWISQAWTITSDARLKTEISLQTNALDQVMKLRPATYQYNQDTPYGLPDGMHHGFIAQEMEEVFPEVVRDIKMPVDPNPEKMHVSGTKEYKGINYTELISVLTAALQELNTTLTAKIDAQAAEIEELKKLVQK